MKFGNVLKQLRKQKGINQETLAELLGISVQAVSKWECELSYPDIELLPMISGYFDVTVDYLLTGSDSVKASYNTYFPNDETLRIVQYKGQQLLTKDLYNPSVKIMIKAEDTINGSVEIWGSADIEGNINGGLDAGDGVNCGNVSGGVNAGDGVNCGNVSGGVNAGDGVNCGNVSGGINAGDGINCGNIDGDIISCNGDIHCNEIKGSIQSSGLVYIK